MLQIKVPASEKYDESKNEFIYTKETTLKLEHSLLSISKWEAKWNVPFLDNREKSREEMIDYIRCMTLNSNVNDDVYYGLSAENHDAITKYINSPMTATTFNDMNKGTGSYEVVTSELIYYWMVAHGIPFECEKWHIQRLLTLIRICGAKNSSPKQMSRRAILEQNKALNSARRARLHSRG